MSGHGGGGAKEGQNIQVVCRCRPLQSGEVGGTVECQKFAKTVTFTHGKTTRTYQFDAVFPEQTTQYNMYNETVERIVDEVLAGFNCTVFAYGQTGTGKTFTMEGDPSDDSMMGVIPRAMQHIFLSLRQRQLSEYTVTVSHLELYNEEFSDLLTKNDQKIELRDQGGGKGIRIFGNSYHRVHDVTEAMALLSESSARRRTACTLMNKNSSRSHCVFMVMVLTEEFNAKGEKVVRTGKLNLVDLAGSENLERAGTIASDVRKKEATCINLSLSTLSRVIDALLRGNHAPYRESKLTRLLQDSLGGKTKTCIIATISPSAKSAEETLSTLEYASRARGIKNTPTANQEEKAESATKNLREQVSRLQKLLKEQFAKNGGVRMSEEEHEELRNDLLDKQSKIDDLETQLIEREQELETFQMHIKEMERRVQVVEAEASVAKEELVLAKAKLEETTDWLSKSKMQLTNFRSEVTFQKKNITELHNLAKVVVDQYEDAISQVEALHSKLERVQIANRENQSRADNFRQGLLSTLGTVTAIVEEFGKENTEKAAMLVDLLDKFFKARMEEFHEVRDSAEKLIEVTSSHFDTAMENPDVVSSQEALRSQFAAVSAASSEFVSKTKTDLEAFVRQVVGISANLKESSQTCVNKMCASSEEWTAIVGNMKRDLSDVVEKVKAACGSLAQESETLKNKHAEMSVSSKNALKKLRAQQKANVAAFQEDLMAQMKARIDAFQKEQESELEAACKLLEENLAGQDAAVMEMAAASTGKADTVLAQMESFSGSSTTRFTTLNRGFDTLAADATEFFNSDVDGAACAPLKSKADAFMAEFTETAGSFETDMAKKMKESTTLHGNFVSSFRGASDNVTKMEREFLDALACTGQMGETACNDEEDEGLPRKVPKIVVEFADDSSAKAHEITETFREYAQGKNDLLSYRPAAKTGATPARRAFSLQQARDVLKKPKESGITFDLKGLLDPQDIEGFSCVKEAPEEKDDTNEAPPRPLTKESASEPALSTLAERKPATKASAAAAQLRSKKHPHPTPMKNKDVAEKGATINQQKRPRTVRSAVPRKGKL